MYKPENSIALGPVNTEFMEVLEEMGSADLQAEIDTIFTIRMEAPWWRRDHLLLHERAREVVMAARILDIR